MTLEGHSMENDPFFRGARPLFDGEEGVWLTISSGSMVPAVAPGDRVCVRAIAPSALSPGDIIAVRRGGLFVVHRLARVEHGMLVTKGDRNARADPPIPVDLVVGKVCRIARSYGTTDLSTPSGLMRDWWDRRLGSVLAGSSRIQSLVAGPVTQLGSRRYARGPLTVPYGILARFIARILGRVQYVRSAYLIHGAARGEILPGLSDLDLLLVLEDAAPGIHAARRARLVRRFRALRRLAPFLGHVAILSNEEAVFLLRHGGTEAFECASWKLIAGSDIRLPRPPASKALLRVAVTRRLVDRFVCLCGDLTALASGSCTRRQLLSARKHAVEVLRLVEVYAGRAPVSDLASRREALLERLAAREGGNSRLASHLVSMSMESRCAARDLMAASFEILLSWDRALAADGITARPITAARARILEGDDRLDWKNMSEPFAFEEFERFVSAAPRVDNRQPVVVTPRIRASISALFPERMPPPREAGDAEMRHQRLADLLFSCALAENPLHLCARGRELLGIFCSERYGIAAASDGTILSCLESHGSRRIVDAAVLLSREVTRRSFEAHLEFVAEVAAELIAASSNPRTVRSAAIDERPLLVGTDP